jgi:hypothetical protein
MYFFTSSNDHNRGSWGGPFAIRRAQLSKKRIVSQCYVAGGWP